MTETLLPETVTPTEAATYFNLIIIGVVGGIGVIALSQLIKNKTKVPASQLAIWGGIYSIVALASVLAIARSAK